MSNRNMILIIVGVVVFIVIVVSVWLVFSAFSSKDASIADLEKEVEDLEWQVSFLGDVVDVYTVAVTKTSGSPFDEKDVEIMSIPSTALNDQYVTDLSMLENAIYKINVENGMPLMKSLFFTEELGHSDRYYDVIADLFPVGAKAGDYYDLRITTPNGLDYIVLAKKRVVEHYGQAVRFVLSEAEIHRYQASLVDVFVNMGSYLYVTTYIEPALQKEAMPFYSVPDLILAVMEIDPNIVKIAAVDRETKNRRAFEKGLVIDSDLNAAVAAGRSEQISRLLDAAKAKVDAAKEIIDNLVDEDGAAASTGTGNMLSGTGKADEASSTETTGGTTSGGTPTSGETPSLNVTPVEPGGIQSGITGGSW